jgi:hypothetical protein
MAAGLTGRVDPPAGLPCHAGPPVSATGARPSRHDGGHFRDESAFRPPGIITIVSDSHLTLQRPV